MIFLKKRIIIASDIDGTLITNKLRMPQINKLAAKKFAKLGGELVIASGRSPLSVKTYVNMIECSEKCIVYNGAGVYDFSGKDFIWKSMLSQKDMMPLVVDVLEKFPDVGVELWSDDCNIYQLRQGYDNTARETVEGIKFTTIDINKDKISDNFFKILFSGEKAVISEVWEYCRANQPQCAVSVCSCPYYCEVLNKNANKMSALKALVESENRETISIAIGDYYNDMEMIVGADFSAAPQNAAEDIRNAADITVCDCRRGAVAELINYVIKHFMEVS